MLVFPQTVEINKRTQPSGHLCLWQCFISSVCIILSSENIRCCLPFIPIFKEPPHVDLLAALCAAVMTSKRGNKIRPANILPVSARSLNCRLPRSAWDGVFKCLSPASTEIQFFTSVFDAHYSLDASLFIKIVVLQGCFLTFGFVSYFPFSTGTVVYNDFSEDNVP